MFYCTTPPRRFAPTDTARSRQKVDRRGCVFSIASPQAYHHAEYLNISCPSGISFGPKPALLSLPNAPHRPAGLRRPIRRNPDRRGCVFSIASPQAYHHAEHLNISCPSGITFGPKPALLSLPTHHVVLTFCINSTRAWGGSGPQRLTRAPGIETGNPIMTFEQAGTTV